MCTICFCAESAPEFPRKRKIDELCSLSPPPPHTLWLHPQTAPIGIGIGEQATIRVVVGAPEGVWWGGVEKSSSISHMLRHPSARQCYFEMKPISAP